MLLIVLKLIACYAYDGIRFVRYAHLFGDPLRSRAAAQANLLRLSHSLEKGMALREPRLGFGRALSVNVVDDLEAYVGRYGADNISGSVVGILESLLAFHGDRGIKWADIEERVSTMKPGKMEVGCGEGGEFGTILIESEKIRSAGPVDPEVFFKSRRSVRQFSELMLTVEEISRAVNLAMRAPSVCNRQAAKVYMVTDPVERELALSFQDGNKGFGDKAPLVFVVVVDLSCFYKNGERNQVYVDGGIFAMALVMAFHAIGCGTCLLNWAMSPRQDRPMRRALGIPDNEVVITMGVAGHLLEEFPVAASPRRLIGEVVRWGHGRSKQRAGLTQPGKN